TITIFTPDSQRIIHTSTNSLDTFGDLVEQIHTTTNTINGDTRTDSVDDYAQFDAAGNPAVGTETRPGFPVTALVYTYDDDERLIGQTNDDGNDGTIDETATVTYDDTGLVSTYVFQSTDPTMPDPYLETDSYDVNGHLIAVHIEETFNNMPDITDM